MASGTKEHTKESMARTLVIGDIHGQKDKLEQALERAGYKEEDLVISVGDIVDRGPDPFGCMLILNDLKHSIVIKGNHDAIFEYYLESGYHSLHGRFGSTETVNAWEAADEATKDFVKRFMSEQRPFYVDRHNYLYVHGGFDTNFPIKDQTPEILWWDRTLWQLAFVDAMKGKKFTATMDGFEKIFIGHTPTLEWGITFPMKKTNIINVDTGSGKGGKLTIMDVVTEEYWQSD